MRGTSQCESHFNHMSGIRERKLFSRTIQKTDTLLHPHSLLSEHALVPIDDVFRFLEATSLLNKL